MRNLEREGRRNFYKLCFAAIVVAALALYGCARDAGVIP